MREKWKKYVEKFKSLGDKVSGVKGITAVIPAVCLAVLMVTVLTGYKTPQAKKYKLQRQKTSVRLRKRLRRKVQQQWQKQRKRIQQRRERRGLLM